MGRLFENQAKAAKYAGPRTSGVDLECRQGRLCVRQRGTGIRTAVTHRAQVKCVAIENRTMHDLVTKLALLSRMLESA